jgi:hypothetical protein
MTLSLQSPSYRQLKDDRKAGLVMRCYTIVRQVTEWHGRCDVPELVQTEMTATARTPITILTGFLGAGKTSLLSRLLRDPRFSDTAVVINEFGEVGLDHLLVEHLAEEPVVEMACAARCAGTSAARSPCSATARSRARFRSSRA